MINLDLASQAQLSVVGSMLIDERCIPRVLDQLRPADFLDGTCRSTFSAIRKLFREGRPVDPVTVVDAMQGGERYIGWVRDVMETTPTAANVGEYIPIVRKAAQRRCILDLAEKLPEADYDEMETLVRKMSSALSAVERMPRMTGQDRASDFYDRMKSKDKPKYLPWGIPTADRAVCASLGDMILLGGYASSGKTLLSILMAQTQAKAGYRVGYYSLETSPEKMTDRQMANLSGVPLGKIKTRDFGEETWDKFAQAAVYASSECPFDVIQAAGATVDDITADAVGHRYQVIYVDYVQLVHVPGMGASASGRYNAVTAISQGLKIFAQSTHTAVVALAQLSRPETILVGKGENKKKVAVPPSMHSFKESGQLEQDADAAFLVWPSDSNDNNSNRVFKIGKNKEGPRPTTYLSFRGDTQTMAELEPSVVAKLVEQGKAIKQANRNSYHQMQFEELEDDGDCPFPEEDN